VSVLQVLQLPPCHILALESLSIYCALRFAVLFPEMCLSLTLCNVPAPTPFQWRHSGHDELLNNWCNAEDLEAFEHVAKEAVEFVVGPGCDPDLQDELIYYWEMTVPPSEAQRVAHALNTLLNRAPLRPDVHASIKQPVLLIHGEHDEACQKQYAEVLASQLSNAEGGAVIYTVKGGAGTLSIIPGHASIANQVFAKFISRHPHTRSELTPRESPIWERMKKALSTLADIMRDNSITSRDPLSSLSFCCLSPEVIKSQTDKLARYRKKSNSVFSPIGPEGRPLRRYSDRKRDHWFYGEKNGLSIAGKAFLVPERAGDSADKFLPQDVAAAVDGRIRHVPGNSTIEKRIIKDSMARVIATPKLPQRLPI